MPHGLKYATKVKIMLMTGKSSSPVSILLVTYNHENYIQQALDSLFGQVIKGPIELVIADDASSDNTTEIIRGYEGRDGRFAFKYLDSSKNIGITKNYQRGFSSCSGKYVAILEGDDYWISPFKLQRQIDFLDTHWEIGLCAVNYFVYEEQRSNFYPRVDADKGYRLIGSRDLILDNMVGNFSTCMYRKTALNALPSSLFEIRSYDWIINICIARNSMIGFLEEPMSVYRLHTSGAWSQAPYLEKLQIQLEVISLYDKLTNHIYHSEFELLAGQIRHNIRNIKRGDIINPIIRSTIKPLPLLADYLPPILLTSVNLLIPPKLKRFILKVFARGTS